MVPSRGTRNPWFSACSRLKCRVENIAGNAGTLSEIIHIYNIRVDLPVNLAAIASIDSYSIIAVELTVNIDVSCDSTWVMHHDAHSNKCYIHIHFFRCDSISRNGL